MKRVKRVISIVAGLALWTLVLIAGTLLVAEALRVKSMPALERWHREQPASEFEAPEGSAATGLAFKDYLDREATIFRELEGFSVDPISARSMSPFIRFVHGGAGDPATFAVNWNRTQIIEPKGAPVGGALLLHGLSDSPYSMRSAAETLRDAGFECICLRYPGHGTVPAGLLLSDWTDWYAAVRLAWTDLERRIGPEKPLIVCGYSTGGALALLLTLDSIEQGLRAPHRLVLFSPAVGITPFAAASNLHRLYSWTTFYEKARWLSIQPEYDPFKYASFPQHAGAQSWALTQHLAAAIERAAGNGALVRMPPVLSFQSLVDSTIVARDLITRLYERLPDNGSGIVCFDVNRGQNLDGLLSGSVPDVRRWLDDSRWPFSFTLITNTAPGSRTVEAIEHAAGQAGSTATPLDAAWPLQVFSLSHVAIPFPPDDPIYGDGTVDPAPHLNIGQLSMRGERGALVLSADDLMRLRFNPFHAYMMKRMLQFIGDR